MPKIKFIATDEYNSRKVITKDIVGDSWPEQVRLFYDFLVAQGFLITKDSVEREFVDIVNEIQEVYEEEFKRRKKDRKERP